MSAAIRGTDISALYKKDFCRELPDENSFTKGLDITIRGLRCVQT